MAIKGKLYTHQRGAFDVARFDNLGNAKAFTQWNERQDWLHVFFMPIRLIGKFDEKIDLKAALSQFLSDRHRKCCNKIISLNASKEIYIFRT